MFECYEFDIEKLIERLKYDAADWAGDHHIKAGLMDAATALSTLQAENEKLRAELERVKRERDAAVEQLHGICDACAHYTPYHNRGKCATCEHEIVRDAKITPSDNWEWRGQKED